MTNQTITSHFNELVNAKLLYRRNCGRFHYYEINGDAVASATEKIASEIPVTDSRDFRRKAKPELKKARFCYDHLAGEPGVEISRMLVKIEALILYQDSFHLPETEHPIYRTISIDLGG